MDSIYVDIGKHIKEYRMSRKLTQEQVADRIAVSSNYYGKVERGTYHLSYNMLSDIYKEFGWDIDYILTGTKRAENPFSALIDKCPENRRQQFVELIIWTLELKVEAMDGIEDARRASFGRMLQIARTCLTSYEEVLSEDQVIYNIRTQCGISNIDMANCLDMNQRSYNGLEKGKCKPAIDTFVRLDEQFGVNPSFIMNGRFENLAAVSEIWNSLPAGEQKSILDFLEQGIAFLCR